MVDMSGFPEVQGSDPKRTTLNDLIGNMPNALVVDVVQEKNGLGVVLAQSQDYADRQFTWVEPIDVLERWAASNPQIDDLLDSAQSIAEDKGFSELDAEDLVI